jgi:hypothetical protein
MDEKEMPQPVLDSLIQSRQLQMLKAIVPYVDESRQQTLSIMIKMIELQKTMQLFEGEPSLQAAELHGCSGDSPTDRACHMLHALREFCTPNEQENIDMFLNFFETFSSYETLFHSSGNESFQKI